MAMVLPRKQYTEVYVNLNFLNQVGREIRSSYMRNEEALDA
jgi:hypothetical protein